MGLVHPVLPSSVCPQPLTVLLLLGALGLALHLGKLISTNACVFLVPWLCCRQWPVPRGAPAAAALAGLLQWCSVGTCLLAADSLSDGI